VVTEWGREISEADLPLFKTYEILLTLGTRDYDDQVVSPGGLEHV